MKTKTLTLLLSLFCISAIADEPKTQLVIWTKDGTKVAYALAEKPKVTFTKTDLVITSNALEVNYSLEKLDRFTYEEGQPTDITNLQTDESSFRLNEESLVFPALNANTTIFIYSLNGTLVFKKTVCQNGEYAFPLSNLNAGVYFIMVNGLTYKIVKK